MVKINSNVCKHCGYELEWIECGACDDGYYDGYDDDPLWYNPGELVKCTQCDGVGGWLECPDAEHHAAKQSAPPTDA